jgi:hypothetical protein
MRTRLLDLPAELLCRVAQVVDPETREPVLSQKDR